MLEKSIKQLNRVSISVSLGLGLVLGLVLWLVLGLMPSSDIVLKSTVLSSLCVPLFLSLAVSKISDLFRKCHRVYLLEQNMIFSKSLCSILLHNDLQTRLCSERLV